MLIPNTFQIKAECERLVEFSSVEELNEVMPLLCQAQKEGKLLIIGRGSNLLPTGAYEGVVVRSRIMGKTIVSDDGEQVLLRCGSGEIVDEVIDWAVEHGLYGMENLSLIPGEVGASAVQNIGAYGAEAKDCIDTIEAVEVATGETHTIPNDACQYAYRHSLFRTERKNRYIITYVTYKLHRTFTPHLDYGNIRQALAERGISAPTARDVRGTIIAIRNAKLPDPDVEGNAGSFFMNPIVTREKYLELAKAYPNMPHYNVDENNEKIPAGWMIDQCGWKGKTLGRAGVHGKQALVLVNRGGADGKEIVELCQRIQDDVRNTFGIEIHPEVNII